MDILIIYKQYGLDKEEVIRYISIDGVEHKRMDKLDKNVKAAVTDFTSIAYHHIMDASKLMTHLLSPSASNTMFKSKELARKEKENQIKLKFVLPKMALPLMCITNFLNYCADGANFDIKKLNSYQNPTLPIQLTWTAFRNKIPHTPRN